MYIPTPNREDDPLVLKAFMRENPLCTLVTMSTHGLVASHIPVVFSETEQGFGLLQGHVARGNAQWRDLSQDVEALAIFTGPQHYISPNWYVGKQTHGEEVPTWNYVAVHACGRLRAIEDPRWLIQHVTALTDQSEILSPVPWKVSDAPAEFIAKMARAIVGLEMEISRVEGRWKASQNRSEEDAVSVTASLDQIGTAESSIMSELIRDRRPHR